MNKAVFLDRDGTLNVDKGYIYRPDDFEFTEHAPDAIRKLCKARYKVIVISNQSGIGRGYYTESELHLLHKHIDNELQKSGAYIDEYYYCPHHPDADCDCRKPKTGLIMRAAAKYDIDITSSWMVGDKPCDAECAANAGLRFVWISNEDGEGKRFTDLLGFVHDLLSETQS